MERLSTDLIGRVFHEDKDRYLVTDRKAQQPGHAVVRKIQGGADYQERPLTYVSSQIQKDY